MIVLADVRPGRVTTYHTEPGTTGVEAKVSRIKDRECYRELAADVARRGFIDPVVAMCTPARACLVEVGEERVLIARALGTESLRAVIYDKDRDGFPYAYARVLRNMDEVAALFGTDDPPGLRVLGKYVAAGIARF